MSDLIERLARAADSIKPEPGMDGPHGGHIGGVTRQRAVDAIEEAIEALAARDRPALDVERHVPFIDRTDPLGVGFLNCSCGAWAEGHNWLAHLDAARSSGEDVEALIAELSESPLPGARYAVTVVRNWRQRALDGRREEG